MRLSGHNYNNQVFESLLDGIADDIVVKSKPKTAQSEVNTEVFTTFDMSKLSAYEQEEIKKIAAELDYAAEQAKLELTLNDLADFRQEVKSQKLRGKQLERAARTFCKNIKQSFAEPKGIVRLSEQLEGRVSEKSVMPAHYGKEGPDNSKTGKYMRSTSNPNSIWDTDALSRLASKTTNETFGDERLAEAKAKSQAFKDKLASDYEKTVKAMAEDPNRINPLMKAITTGEEDRHNAALPKNATSMFGNYSELDNLPEKTAGEKIAVEKAEQATRKEAEKKEFRTAEAKKIDNTLSGNQGNKIRSTLDTFFDNITKSVK